MKGKRVIAGILLVGILATALAGCKNADVTKKEREKPVITLGSDSYPPYNYLNEDGIPTGIDVELATEAFRRMGYQVDVVQINWEKKKELVESGEIDCIMGCFSMEGRLDDYRWAGPVSPNKASGSRPPCPPPAPEARRGIARPPPVVTGCPVYASSPRL